MLRGDDGGNINGPSLIRAPDWLPRRLGTYYLYFAHHTGTYIRLAVADRLEGPWRVYEPGTLKLADATAARDHIASPDVHVDDARRRIVMGFHAPVAGRARQMSFLAQSEDGLAFVADPRPIANFYLRLVPWGKGWIGMSKGGVMYRAPSLDGPFRRLWRPAFPMSGRDANGRGDVRHVALHCEGDRLTVYFSRIGDAPERILAADIDLGRLPMLWRAGPAREVLAPEFEWEGSGLALRPSRAGAAAGPENALRDPAVFTAGGRQFLIYAVAGESGLGLAELL
jgi:hypothetical protein